MKHKMVLPTFILAGAGKSGTSYIFDILNNHSDIFLSTVKEPAFFSTFNGRGLYHKGMEFYQKNFINYNGEKDVGEASTVYMYDPASPDLIKHYIPNIKLIFSLRNPVERIYSNYWQELKSGKSLPDFKSFLYSRSHRLIEMIYVSRYDIHMDRYYKTFDKGQILVLLLEEMKIDYEKTFGQILSFLGLKPFQDPVDYNSKSNRSTLPRSAFLARLFKNDVLVKLARGHLPARLIEPTQSVIAALRRSIQTPFEYPPMDKDCALLLQDIFQESIENLSALLGRDLSIWLK